MINDNIANSLKQIISSEKLFLKEPLSLHTTFQVGGPADYFTIPSTEKQLIDLISFCLDCNLPFFILGKGSNLIVSDKGIRGIVISTEKLKRVYYKDNLLTAGCGNEIVRLSNNSAKRGLSGLEFACGIPGSVGGAVFMNAGAYEGEICQVLLSSRVLALHPERQTGEKTEVISLSLEDHHFSYRHSVLQEKGYVHLSSIFNLLYHNKNSITATIRKLTKAREDKQPLELPSAGSVFRRPQGHFTGKLIEDCGLKGFRIGDAAVSTKHCGFIVNLGKATAADIKSVVNHVRETVLDKCGVELQVEVKFVGEE
jgi:UDP-N-acetylmuramate dehydrogenase